MTREEAINLLDNLIGMVEDNHNSNYDTALRIAIKTLEQEPILDKIRAEIIELDNKVCQQFLIEDIDKEVHRTYRECIDIIDKYKAESEKV